ncbi:MAG: hypothetical protein DCF22_14065 [Leptolyngbya sp.]|nr:MAG: hypothetical protein DCF22_14065 [Leptolyngbya sp.]
MTKYFYKTLMFGAIAISIMSVCSQPIRAVASEPEVDDRVEETPQSSMRDWSFAFENYPMNHQWMANTLNIAVRYTLKPNASSRNAPDFTTMFNQVTRSLAHHPQDDYWEIVNRKLTDVILRENPALYSVTIRLQVQPRTKVPFTCTTTVTRTASGELVEAWSFSAMNLSVDQPGRKAVNVYVDYTYKTGILDSEYPDFVPIQNQVAEFLKDYPRQVTNWEVVNRNLAGAILSEYPAISSITLRLEVLPTEQLPYTHSSTVTLIQPLDSTLITYEIP